MKTSPAILIAMLLLGAAEIPADGSGTAQTLQIEKATGTAGGFNLLWPGRPGRSYFIQRSENLSGWAYLPEVTPGQGTTEQWWFASDGDALFMRLRFTDIPTNDPELADFDLDGIATMTELSVYGTDPLDADTDHDGLSDGEEIANSANPLDPANGTTASTKDTDGDGIRDALEVARGTSPLLADSDADGVPDNQDAYPLDPTRHTNAVPNPADTTAPSVTLDSPANAVLLP